MQTLFDGGNRPPEPEGARPSLGSNAQRQPPGTVNFQYKPSSSPIGCTDCWAAYERANKWGHEKSIYSLMNGQMMAIQFNERVRLKSSYNALKIMCKQAEQVGIADIAR